MKRTFGVCLFLFAFVALALTFVGPNQASIPHAAAQPAIIQGKEPVQNRDMFSGIYLVEGKDQMKKPYQGSLLIQKQKNVYYCVWTLTNGTTFMGPAIMISERAFVASWANPEGNRMGVTSFTVHPGNKMEGITAMIPTTGDHGSETLTFLRKLNNVPTPDPD